MSSRTVVGEISRTLTDCGTPGSPATENEKLGCYKKTADTLKPPYQKSSYTQRDAKSCPINNNTDNDNNNNNSNKQQ